MKSVPKDRVDEILAQWHRERPDLDVAAMGPLGRFTRLCLHLAREMGKTFEAHGLNNATFDVLATLRRSGAPYRLSPGDLLAAQMVTSGTMTNRLDQLERVGLISRTPNPEDRRSMIVALTEKGLSVIDAAVAEHTRTQARLMSGLSPEEVMALDSLLRVFLARFEGGAGV